MVVNKIKLTEQLEEKFKKDKAPSVALQVKINNEKEYDCFYGAFDEAGNKPTASTLYGVASLTKSVTAVGIMKLVDEEKLRVTDLVSDWLPELKLPDSSNEKITIHHLLTHTAGFPGMTALNLARVESLNRDPDGAYLFGELPRSKRQVGTVKDMIEAMNELDYQLIAEPGKLFNYSNEGFALLEEIIKRASNDSYVNYIKENIFTPLNMNHSVFTVAALEDFTEVARPYAFTKDKARKVFYSPTWWEIGEIYGAGALKSTTNDLLKYLEIFKSNQILSEESVEAMTTSHIKTPNENEYGYGLMVGEFEGKKVIGHGGGVKGVSSYMLVCKALDFSAVALTNIQELAAEDYLLSIFSKITGTNVNLQVNKSTDLVELDKYVGEYATSEGNEILVSQLSDNQLQLVIDHLTIEIEHEKENLFILPNGKKLAFVSQNGQITGVFRGMRYIEKVK